MRRHAAAVLAATLILAGCAGEPQPETVTTSETTETTTVVPDATITIRSVGDILVHSDVYNAAATDEGYDFSPMFAPVKEYMEDADITTANMEVPVAGPQYRLSGYPQFNAPPEIIDGLLDAGVDIVNNATNHSLDRGGEGVSASVSNMRERGMPYSGSFSSEQDRDTPRIIEENGIKVGFLSYTYGTNGLPVPEEYMVNLIDPEPMARDLAALDEQVDVLVTMLHMGEEYSPLPVEYQKEMAQIALDNGAEYVLGGHPHVVEPFEVASDHVIWWSHGNFLHGQWEENTKVGGIGEVTFRKKGDGTVLVDDVRYMPTYTIGPPISYNHKVIPLVDAGDYIDVDAWREELRERMNVEVVDYL